MSPRRFGTAAAVLLVLGGTALPASAAPAAAGAPPCAPQSYDTLTISNADLNADGYADLAVGVPDASAPGLAGAGVMDVHYPRPSYDTHGPAPQRFSEAFFRETAAAGDHFGASSAFLAPIATYGCYGIAIGAPGAAGGLGRVTLAHGTNAGVSAADATVLTGPAAGDGFGSVVVADNTFADDTVQDASEVWVGAPDATVAGFAGAGAIYHYHYVPSTSTATLVQVITENSPFVPGDAAAGDHFGAALSADRGSDLAVGIPGKAVNGRAGAGAAGILRPASNGRGQLIGGAVISQDSPGVGGQAEAGDGFGSSVSLVDNILAVGVPGEDVGTLANAGVVQMFYDGYGAKQNVVRIGVGEYLSQDTPGIPGVSEAGDGFGTAVQVGPGDAGGGESNQPYLWIGAPGESLGTVQQQGDVVPLWVPLNSSTWQQHGKIITLDSDSLPGPQQAGAHVGQTLGLFSYSDLGNTDVVNGDGVAVDVPGLAAGGPNTGEVGVVGALQTRDGNGVFADSAGPRANEYYGVAASNVSNGVFDDG